MSTCCLCVCLQTRYVRSSREIKRLDSLALSPIFTHFSETLQARPGQGQGGAWLDGGRGCSGCSSARAVALAAPVYSTACLRDLSMGGLLGLPTVRSFQTRVTCAPPHHHPQGLVTVRAFRQQAPFQQRSTQLLDASNRAWWPAQVCRLGWAGPLPGVPNRMRFELAMAAT